MAAVPLHERGIARPGAAAEVGHRNGWALQDCRYRHAADQVEQRGLPGAGGTQQDHELTGTDLKVHIFERVDRGGPRAVGAPHGLQSQRGMARSCCRLGCRCGIK